MTNFSADENIQQKQMIQLSQTFETGSFLLKWKTLTEKVKKCIIAETHKTHKQIYEYVSRYINGK